MSNSVPEKASAVVIGGGVTGASVAYHLAKLGWNDVVLLERKQFACGTTWHAAGLIGTMRANESHAKLCEYSMAVLSELEAETGQSTGFRQVGSLSIAHSVARFEELKRVAAMNNAFGVTRVDIVTPEEIKSLYPLLKTSDLLGGSWVAQDGQGSPVDIVQAFIKGARKHGAKCLEGVKVTGIRVNDGRVAGVATEQGEIRSEFVVNCAGMWARALGKMAGVNVPLHACEHYYAHTEKLDDLPPDMPVMRDHDKCAYYREDAGSILVGAFEQNARPWGMEGIPEDFCFDELPGHVEDQLMPVLEDAMERVPMLQNVGWRKLLLRAGELYARRPVSLGRGAGSSGIFSSPPASTRSASSPPAASARPWPNGWRPATRPWTCGETTFAACIPSTAPSAISKSAYRRPSGCSTKSTGRTGSTPPRAGFGTRRSTNFWPTHGACFGEVAGWERPNWFAPQGVEPVYEYSFGSGRTGSSTRPTSTAPRAKG